MTTSSNGAAPKTATRSTSSAKSRSATKPAEPETAEQSMVDQLAEDAKPVTLPDDAPAMTPYLRLPYRKRGQFMEKMARVQEMAPSRSSAQKTAKAGSKAGAKIDLEEVSGYYYLLAELDELLRLVVHDEDELDRWQGEHDDSEFVELYNTYMRWSQVGEASSSAS